MKENGNEDRRGVKRTCCSLDTEFSFDRKTFKGRIENMSNFGAIVLSGEPLEVTEGKNIRLSIMCDGKEDILEAQVVWFEDKAFGAKFIRRPSTNG